MSRIVLDDKANSALLRRSGLSGSCEQLFSAGESLILALR
jgi:hypothetical protein